MAKKHSTKSNDCDQLDEYLMKKGLTKTYNIGDIVIVKLKHDKSPWPGKISQMFIQQIKEKQQDSLQDQYDPDQQLTTKKKPKPKRKTQTKKQQLVYRVRYFGIQEFVYSEEKFIQPYTIKMEKQLEDTGDRTLSKALELARKEMSQQQKEIVKNSSGEVEKKKGSNGGGKRKKKIQQENQDQRKNDKHEKTDLNQKEESIPSDKQEEQDSHTTQPSVIDKKQEKKKKIQQKILKIQQSIQRKAHKLKQQAKVPLETKKGTQTLISKKKVQENEQPPTIQSFVQPIIQQQTPILCEGTQNVVVKQEYVQEESHIRESVQKQPHQQHQSDITASSHSNSQQKSCQSSENTSSQSNQQQSHNAPSSTISNPSSQPFSHEQQSTPSLPTFSHPQHPTPKIREQYILDNILYKNKFQLLAVFRDLLEAFISKVLEANYYVEGQNKKKKQTRSEFVMKPEEERKFNALKKVLDAEIFTLEELSKSECCQKMLNTVLFCETTLFRKQKLHQKEFNSTSIKKLHKIYSIIHHQLKAFGKLPYQTIDYSCQKGSKTKKNLPNHQPYLSEDKKNCQHEEQTASSDYVQPINKIACNKQTRSKPEQSSLKIDYCTAFSISSNQLD